MARRPRRNASAGNPCRPNSTCRAEAAGCLLRRGLRDTALPGGPQQPAPQVKPNKQPVKAPTRPSTPRPPKECALAARPSLGSKLPLQKERPKRQLLTDSKAHSHIRWQLRQTRSLERRMPEPKKTVHGRCAARHGRSHPLALSCTAAASGPTLTLDPVWEAKPTGQSKRLPGRHGPDVCTLNVKCANV